MTFKLPENYEVPKSQSNYTKLEQGDNLLRILGAPILGWVGWVDGEDGKKPHRFPMNERPIDLRPFDKQKVSHFWALPVWNYKEEKVQIFEITQKTIQTAIENLYKDADWGDPTGYDIKITRSGEGLETEYSVLGKPHKPLPASVKEAYAEAKINLNALFKGEDPFNSDTPTPVEPFTTSSEYPAGYPTPEEEGIDPKNIPF